MLAYPVLIGWLFLTGRIDNVHSVGPFVDQASCEKIRKDLLTDQDLHISSYIRGGYFTSVCFESGKIVPITKE